MTCKEFKNQAAKFKAMLEAMRPRFRVKHDNKPDRFEAVLTDTGNVKIEHSELELPRHLLHDFSKWVSSMYDEEEQCK